MPTKPEELVNDKLESEESAEARPKARESAEARPKARESAEARPKARESAEARPKLEAAKSQMRDLSLGNTLAVTSGCITMLSLIEVCYKVLSNSIEVNAKLQVPLLGLGIDLGSAILDQNHLSATLGGEDLGYVAEVDVTFDFLDRMLLLHAKLCVPDEPCYEASTSIKLGDSLNDLQRKGMFANLIINKDRPSSVALARSLRETPGKAGIPQIPRIYMAPMASPNQEVTQLQVTITTGDDDLRSDSTADAFIHAGPRNQKFSVDLNPSQQGLPGGSTRVFKLDCAPLQVSDIRDFGIEYQSHNSWTETDDNWDIDGVVVQYPLDEGGYGTLVDLHDRANHVTRLTGHNTQWTTPL